MKTKEFLPCTVNCQWSRQTAHKMGEKFISHNSERGLTSIIHNELNQLNTKNKKKTAIQKRG